MSCGGTRLHGRLPAGAHLEQLAAIDPRGLFVADAAGRRVALARDGLRLLDRRAAGERLLARERPAALAWSADGERLLAAFAGDGAGPPGRLALFSADGARIAETPLLARPVAVAWSGQRALAMTVSAKSYSFGVQLDASLQHWDGHGPPRSAPLWETLLRPRTAQRLGEGIYGALLFEASPLGDAVIYARPRDPPNVGAHRRLVLQHLGSGARRELGRLPFAAGTARFTGDGEHVLVAGGEGVRRVPTWAAAAPGGEAKSWLAVPPVRRLARSAGGRYLLVDRVLFRDGAPVGELADDVVGCFAGSTLLLRHGATLYAVAGLRDSRAPQLRGPLRDRLLQLRRLRSQELITAEDYRLSRARLIAHASP